MKDFVGLNDWSPHHGLGELEAGAGVGVRLHDNAIVRDWFSASGTSGWSAYDRWSMSTMDNIW